MTEFYASSVKRKVRVPDNKVCGYTMRSEYDKRASSGLRAGRDNGVVSQKLSRYATKHDAQIKHPCAGNTNWLNPKFEGFYKSRGGQAFKINRPSFRVGETYHQDRTPPPLQPNSRRGLGNRDITRKNFEASNIRARNSTFASLQATDIASLGNVVELGDKTLGELLKVDIPDIQDVKWIAEEARLRALYSNPPWNMSEIEIDQTLKANKPLGREQRTIKGVRGDELKQANLTASQQLTALIQEVKDGRAESKAQQARIIAELGIVLNETQTIQNATRQQIEDLTAIISRLGVPVNHKLMGLEPRIVDNAYYHANSGLINLLLLSKVRSSVPDANFPKYNFNSPVKNFADMKNPVIKLSSMVTALQRKGDARRYLDLDRGGVINEDQKNVIVAQLSPSDVSIIQQAPPAPPAPPGLQPIP